jgi:hypothetical protein
MSALSLSPSNPPSSSSTPSDSDAITRPSAVYLPPPEYSVDPNVKFPDATPSYELPSYDSSADERPQYHTYEPPVDEEIPSYEPRTSESATDTQQPDGRALAESFRKNFKTSRWVAVTTAVATFVLSLVGVLQASSRTGISGSGGYAGLWVAVVVSGAGWLMETCFGGSWNSERDQFRISKLIGPLSSHRRPHLLPTPHPSLRRVPTRSLAATSTNPVRGLHRRDLSDGSFGVGAVEPVLLSGRWVSARMEPSLRGEMGCF